MNFQILNLVCSLQSTCNNNEAAYNIWSEFKISEICATLFAFDEPNKLLNLETSMKIKFQDNLILQFKQQLQLTRSMSMKKNLCLSQTVKVCCSLHQFEYVLFSHDVGFGYTFQGKNLIISTHFLAAGGHKGPRNQGENHLEPSKRIPFDLHAERSYRARTSAHAWGPMRAQESLSVVSAPLAKLFPLINMQDSNLFIKIMVGLKIASFFNHKGDKYVTITVLMMLLLSTTAGECRLP